MSDGRGDPAPLTGLVRRGDGLSPLWRPQLLPGVEAAVLMFTVCFPAELCVLVKVPVLVVLAKLAHTGPCS